MLSNTKSLSPLKYACALFFLFSVLSLGAQSVSGVRAEQTGDSIIVYYDIFGAGSGQTFDVSLHYSTDQGKSWSPALTSVSGDAGLGLLGGSGKKIIWEVLQEGLRLTGGQIRFEVRAVARKKKTEMPGQKGWLNLNGVVYGLRSRAPMGGVNVIVLGRESGTVTEPDGRFSLSGVPAGSELKFSKFSYQSKTITVSSSGRPVEVYLYEAYTAGSSLPMDAIMGAYMGIGSGIRYTPFTWKGMIDIGDITTVGFFYRSENLWRRGNFVYHIEAWSPRISPFLQVSGEYSKKEIELEEVVFSSRDFLVKAHTQALIGQELRLSGFAGFGQNRFNDGKQILDQFQFPVGGALIYRERSKIFGAYQFRRDYPEYHIGFEQKIPLFLGKNEIDFLARITHEATFDYSDFIFTIGVDITDFF